MSNKSDIDINELFRYVGSMDFTVPTLSILKLQENIDNWITMNDCGAIIYGESRIGKTRAIKYISEKLQDTYGKEMPIYNLNCTSHMVQQKSFYESILTAMRHEDAHKGTAVQLRQKIIDRIVANTIGTKYKRAILFIDEAYLLNDREYNWLIDIYNELALEDVLLTTFLFGTEELKSVKTGFIRANQKQIVHRFMVREYEFRGIMSVNDTSVCLMSLDAPFYLPSYKKPIKLSETFFPLAFADKKGLEDCAEDLWESFTEINLQNNIRTDQILMKYFIDTILICLRRYGINGEEIYFPTKEEWINCILESGYLSSQI